MTSTSSRFILCFRMIDEMWGGLAHLCSLEMSIKDVFPGGTKMCCRESY